MTEAIYMSVVAPITFPDFAIAGIETKYLGPTNTKGGRIKARWTDHRAGDPTVTIGYDHSLNTYDNHVAATRALAEKLEWGGRWVGATTERGYVFAHVTRAEA